MDRDSLIQKVRSLPEDSLKEVMDFIEQLEKKKRKTGEKKKEKKDLLEDVIGICEGPPDLAERHDNYVYG
jgi:predicted ATPase with chaperone activity